MRLDSGLSLLQVDFFYYFENKLLCDKIHQVSWVPKFGNDKIPSDKILHDRIPHDKIPPDNLGRKSHY